MKYEELKKLIDAGVFKRKVVGGSYHFWNENDKSGEAISNSTLIPDLAELIEVVGKDFDELKSPYHKQEEGYPQYNEWWAEATNRTGICTKGSTPEEAVAKLLLEILNREAVTPYDNMR